MVTASRANQASILETKVEAGGQPVSPCGGEKWAQCSGRRLHNDTVIARGSMGRYKVLTPGGALYRSLMEGRAAQEQLDQRPGQRLNVDHFDLGVRRRRRELLGLWRSHQAHLFIVK